MKKITLTLVFIVFTFSNLQAQSVFEKAKESKETREFSKEHELPGNTSFYSFNYEVFVSSIINAPKEDEIGMIAKPNITLPSSKGDMVKYNVIEASSFTPELQERFPEIRSYVGNGIDNASEYLRFSVSPYRGLDLTVLNANGGTEIIVPVSKNLVAVYNRSDRTTKPDFECSTADKIEGKSNVSEVDEYLYKNADDGVRRTFLTAISVTGEYSAYHGGTVPAALSAMNASLTRINSVYEQEFNVRMTLVNNTNIIYTNAGTDPYSTSAGFNGELSGVLDGEYPGGVGYDVGHLFAVEADNGNAGCIGCICVIGGGNHKGSAFTSATIPTGERFDIDYVAHEYGHQFGGEHTFNHTPNHSNVSMMEPGSGTTIMGYAGITGATDVQQVSDPYFHAVSIDQITTHVKSRTCDTETATGNTTPTVSAGANLTLPIGTAFKLIGSGNDVDGDAITFCWEQYDEENGANAYPSETSTNSDRPLYRSYNPTTSTERIFPLLSDLVANGVNGNTWEKVPTVARTADFRLTVRDNRAGGGSNDHDDMIVTWDASFGPLEVTTQNNATLSYNLGETITVNWNRNNTQNLTGSSNVNILLSTDEGVTFSTLVANIANSGTANVTLPGTAHQKCRLMIEPTGNQYFAINTENFAIGYDVTTGTVCNTYNFNMNTTLGSNATAFELFGNQNIADSGTITDVNVQYDMTGLNAGMHLAIISAGGTRAYLYPNSCGTGSNMQVVWDEDAAGAVVCGNATTTGSAVPATVGPPAEPLSGLNGEEMNGDWTFMAANIAADVKVFNSVALEICKTDTVFTLNVEEQNGDFADFAVFPNPSNGAFTVNLSSVEDVKMALYDLRGRNVYSEVHSNNSTSFSKEVNFTGMASGVYLLNVESGSKKATKKIVIQ